MALERPRLIQNDDEFDSLPEGHPLEQLKAALDAYVERNSDVLRIQCKDAEFAALGAPAYFRAAFVAVAFRWSTEAHFLSELNLHRGLRRLAGPEALRSEASRIQLVQNLPALLKRRRFRRLVEEFLEQAPIKAILHHPELGIQLANEPRSVRKRKAEKRWAVPKRQLRIGWVFAMSIAIFVGMAGIVVSVLWFSLPSSAEIKTLINRPTFVVRTDSDSKIGFRDAVFPVPIAYDELPDHLVGALIAVEDHRFRYHFGFDPIGFTLAIVNYCLERLGLRHHPRGASTITQQLAKNLFLTPERSAMRKLREFVLALKLEALFTGDEIIAHHLNRAFFGSRLYGVELASRYYFGVKARDLNLYQAAMLVGMLKAPARSNPETNLAAAHARAALVLAQMVKHGKIDEDSRQSALAKWHEAPVNRLHTGSREVRYVDHGYFRDWMLAELRDRSLPPDQTLRVSVTLDPLMQIYGQLAVQRILKAGRKFNVRQGALVAMTPEGAVRAMVGGRSYGTKQFNLVTQAARPAASAFKPFVFLAALEAGYRADQKISDRPRRVDGKIWPRNFQGSYAGEVTVEDALVHSLNAATVNLSEAIGREKIMSLARDLGIEGALPDKLSLALGAGTVKLMNLTRAYATFANGGLKVANHGIVAMHDRDGSVRYRRRATKRRRVVATGTIEKLNRMLRQVVARGTGRKASLNNRIAGKTGTSQHHRDAWFIGFTGDLVVGIWIGANENQSMHKSITGGGLPAFYFANFIANVYDGREPLAPPGVAP